MISNPLRDPRDRRLPRVPEPCALVVFGITGDLARKKLLPAVYDLANRGLLPTNFALLGFARRDWGDEEFADLARTRRPGGRPDAVARGGVGAAGGDDALRPRRVRRRQRLRPADHRARRPPGQPRHRRQRRLLPVHPAGDVPDRAQADAAHGHGRDDPRPVATGRGREAVRRGPALEPRAQRAGRLGVRRGGRLPHRPLPGQGDRPEPAGAAVRQRAVRADLERPERRLGADHHGRGRRHRRPGPVLREDRRRPRRAAEPPAAAARAHRHGGAGRVLRRGDPHREAQDPAGDLAADRPGDLRDPRPVRAGLAGRAARPGLPAGGRRRRGLDDRDLRRGAAGRRDPALGRGPVLRTGRASGCRGG